MRRLVDIDLRKADVGLFEAYEDAVLPLVPQHGGRVEARVRAVTGDREFHLVHFPTDDAYAAYRDDPRRLEAFDLLTRSGAVVQVTLVETFGSP